MDVPSNIKTDGVSRQPLCSKTGSITLTPNDRFSGDTMPTDSLVRIGMNSTVLIHEATMGDDEVDLAAKTAHSTIRQAIGIGKK